MSACQGRRCCRPRCQQGAALAALPQQCTWFQTRRAALRHWKHGTWAGLQCMSGCSAPQTCDTATWRIRSAAPLLSVSMDEECAECDRHQGRTLRAASHPVRFSLSLGCTKAKHSPGASRICVLLRRLPIQAQCGLMCCFEGLLHDVLGCAAFAGVYDRQLCCKVLQHGTASCLRGELAKHAMPCMNPEALKPDGVKPT